MKRINLSYFGQTRYWWILTVVGVLMILGGFAYWFYPFTGYIVASRLFGWLLITAGTIQVCVSSGPNSARGWGWWLIGGILDMLIGFVLVRNVVMSETILPYFMAVIFLYWGIESFVSAFSRRGKGIWWLSLVNGILLLLISYFLFESGFLSDILMVSALVAIGFVYWGFSLAITSYDLRPQ
jgi:uncharacterized membrane protein HdeD (DUF308 family)